jgi:hypothetical protein
MQADRTPVFVRTHDFVLWLFPHTAKFPKVLRLTLTNRMEGTLLDFQGALLRANRLRGDRRLAALDEADALLDAIRFLVRLATDLGCLSGCRFRKLWH